MFGVCKVYNTVTPNYNVQNYNSRAKEELRMKQYNFQNTNRSSFEFSLKIILYVYQQLKILNVTNSFVTYVKARSMLMVTISVYTVNQLIEHCAFA